MFYVLLIAIAVVHLELEYRLWIAREDDIFRKYHDETVPPLTAAKWAYLSKAVWLVALIFLQAFGIEFRTALFLSFAAYALLIQVLLPFKVYNLLNLLLALGCLGELAWRHWQ